jgi:methyltransferase (TIGR00027 family)
MSDQQSPVPDHTAVRVALWRALHVQLDPPPHIIEDEIGLKLADPGEAWRQRPDMDPQRTKRSRASIAVRARFIEDLVEEQSAQGLKQYVILGAGLDSFAQRRAQLGSRLTVFEIDKPTTQEWKRMRLIELGFDIPEWLKLVPVDFEAGESWLEKLARAGFQKNQPAVVASTGVIMYLTREAVEASLKEIAKLAPGSALAMTFILPMDLIDPEERPGLEVAAKMARAAGTPFLSSFSPEEIQTLARDCGFKTAKHVSPAEMTKRYFAGRTDDLKPGSGEHMLVART